MSNETIVVRGAESDLIRFRADLETFLSEQKIDSSDLAPTESRRVKRKLTDPAALGHEALLEFALGIGQAVAIGVLTGVLKDFITAWIKEQAKKRGLLAEVKQD